MASHPFLRAKREAQAIVRRCHISAPEHIDLAAIAALYEVYYLEAHLQGADARLQIQGNTGLVTVRADIPEIGRKRFALAHDIGHFLLHRSRTRLRTCSESEFLRWYRTNDEEPEANVFAAELLMPEDLFVSYCAGRKPGFETVSQLAEIFKTSLSAAAYRYAEIGNYPCALIASKEGKIAWFTTTEDFQHRIREVGSSVYRNSCAGDFLLANSLPPNQPEPVGAFCWLESANLDAKVNLYEHAVALGQYRTVLSLIWIQ
jgi:Zn-dependent peptidase ImmA (M78 family)